MGSAWSKAHREEMTAYLKAWRAKNPDRRHAAQNEYVKRNPEKRKAHVAIGNALRRKKITKPSICENCEKETDRIGAHHPDYTKVFDVIWLCPRCHASEHTNGKA